MQHQIVEIDAWQLPAGPLTTLRYSSGRGVTTRPSDVPPNALIAPRLGVPLLARRDLFSRATTYGRTESGPGELRLINLDGALDVLLTDFAIVGRSVRVYDGTEGDAFPSAWTLAARCVVESISDDGAELLLGLRDPLSLLDAPLLTVQYAGDNVAPAGVEGDSALKATLKPRIYGGVMNISPICVNAARLIYQLSDRAASVSAVYDRGVLLTAGAAYADAADMQANSPAAGQYRVCSSAAGCYVRLGSSPAGTVTADAATGETRAAALAQQVAADMGIASISGADVAALNAVSPAPVGVWCTDGAVALDVLDQLLGSVGAWYGFDRTNTLRMARLEAPAGSSYSIPAVNVLECRLLSTADSDQGVDAWRVALDYARNHTVQSDLAASVSDARRSWVAMESRQASETDAGVKTAWPTSPEIVASTALLNAADAQAEAARRLALYGRRRQYSVTARLATADMLAVEPGQTVTLFYHRYGLSAGLALRVIGVEINRQFGEIKFRLWG